MKTTRELSTRGAPVESITLLPSKAPGSSLGGPPTLSYLAQECGALRWLRGAQDPDEARSRPASSPAGLSPRWAGHTGRPPRSEREGGTLATAAEAGPDAVSAPDPRAWAGH